jgi:hypothetical protein
MLQPRQPDPPVNSVVSYHAGEPKTPCYQGFTVVDSRKLPPELVDLAWAAGATARFLRLERVRREQGFEYWFQARAYLRDQEAAEAANREWPVVDIPEWTVRSDETLTGEDVAQVLGLDDEWRSILGLPPNSQVSREQMQRLAGVALTRGYMHAVDTKLAELFGEDPPSPPTLADAVRYYDKARAEEEHADG